MLVGLLNEDIGVESRYGAHVLLTRATRVEWMHAYLLSVRARHCEIWYAV